jgi:hypothetical protein
MRTFGRTHFQRRMMERFGIEITDDERNAIAVFLRRGGGEFVAGSGDRVTYAVCIKGQDCMVVFDRRHGQLVTALRRNWAVKP